jgi:catechol 2,3-dioxygenase-like lactoylglutathione lyase family enzyme
MASDDARPPLWVGHVLLRTPDIPATRELMLRIGMRDIAHGADFAVLELRGGTHLLLLPADEAASGAASFDLMVDDLDAFHARLRALGLEPSEIRDGGVHRSFTLPSPSGHSLTFNSSHVSALPV